MNARLAIPFPDVEAYCRRNHIRRMALFGSVLRADFTAESDVDVLVEFEPGKTPGLDFFKIERELSALFARRVDLNTPQCLSKYFRTTVLAAAEDLFVAA